MTVTRICPTCSFTGTYATDGSADHHHGSHSCGRHLQLTEVAHRRAERATFGPTRECHHERTTHVHGTRVAYVKDRCRCSACTAANTAASRATQRERVYGRWEPFVAAGPAREHIVDLRAAGFGLRRLAQLADVSPTTLRAVIEPRTDARAVKIRPATAAAILAIDLARAARSPKSTVDSTGTRRRLQALVAIGWSVGELAAQLDRTTAHLTRTMSGVRVTLAVADRVRDVYEKLWDVRPPQDTAAARSARAIAARNQWRTPLAWDDIDTDPEPVPENDEESRGIDDLDEIAIERAVAGDHVHLDQLTPAEQHETIRRMTQRGQSIREIAEQLRTTTRTVSRRRRTVADAA